MHRQTWPWTPFDTFYLYCNSRASCYDLPVAEFTDKSIKKTIINLSRNTPVALVVGAAGFVGSNLVDKLLLKNIQVIGVDNFKSGRKENLMHATKSSYFHLVYEDAENLELEVERLDYIFVVTGPNWGINNLLKIFKNTQARLLFASYIELYSSKNLDQELEWFKKTELHIARFAQENKLNARILRLGTIFGPRMHFKEDDPTVKLIREVLTDNLQKDTPLEFSSRALFISDVLDLMIKCSLSGATAQRIFDGVSPSPIKVSEVKQVLLDPIWYEEKGFEATELPPWTTPNLEKTMKFLNWKPRMNLVASLKETLSYFKSSEIKIESESPSKNTEADKKNMELSEEKKEQIKALRNEEIKMPKTKKKISFPLGKIYFILVIFVVVYAFIWPPVAISLGILTFKYQISEAVKNLEKGEFESGLNNVAVASVGIGEAKKMFDSLEPARKINLFNNVFKTGDNLSDLATLTSDSTQNTILGIQALHLGLKAVSGESSDSPKGYFENAQIYLSKADEDLSKAQALLESRDFSSTIPGILKSNVDSLSGKLSGFSALVKKGRAITSILPEVVAMEGTKSYLILLQNNMELRPTGGFIGSFARISFAGGKLKKLEVNDIYAIDGQLKTHVEPPPEIKADLGQNDWYLRDANWEPDFPTSARQVEWFYNKEVEERVDGTFALDISAMEDLLTVLGPLNLSDYNEKITSDNLFEKAVSHAEVSFFPGSQAKKSFLTSLSNEVFNKLFFVPHQNWPGIVSSLGKSLEQKHMSMYLDDPKLFSYVVSQNWAGEMPRQPAPTPGILQDFLATVEANLGANKANFYLDRKYNLESVIGKEGEVNHRLRIAYTNRSPSETFPAGKYKDRFRIYLPFGAKLNRALWAETDITKNVVSFVDYGRTGYSVLLELAPKEQKTLVLDYQLSQKLEFGGGVAKYRLDVLKQAGIQKDPFFWKISYPINYRLSSAQTQSLGPQEQTIQTDLSVNRSFEVEFRK